MATQAQLLQVQREPKEPRARRRDLRKTLRALGRLRGSKRGRRGQETLTLVIIAVVVLVMAIAIAVMLYGRAVGALGAVGTAEVSAFQLSGGGVAVTITAAGGSVTIQGIQLLDASGTNLVAAGTCTPASSTSGSTSLPQTIQNGQSVTFFYSGSACSQALQVVVTYNNGKVTTASIG